MYCCVPPSHTVLPCAVVRFAVQVVRTTVEPLGGKHAGTHYDAYEYLANHHSYKRDEHPTVKITYNLSPLQVCVDGPQAWSPALSGPVWSLEHHLGGGVVRHQAGSGDKMRSKSYKQRCHQGLRTRPTPPAS